MDKLIIRGAREHNLKNIDLVLPRDKFIVFSGVSGSGKSTLAFDTIYAEGQRRYVESLSAYARQFLGLMTKPDIDSIEGLSPAISIEQKGTSKNPRSTVGTVTEIYDYLRLLFARVGTPYCPNHKIKIQKKSSEIISDEIFEKYKDSDIIILAPIIRQKKGTYEKLIEDLDKDGYSRVRVNKKIIKTNEKIKLERYKKHDIEVVIDRLNTNDKQRLSESIENAIKKSVDRLLIILDKNDSEELFSSNMSCPKCGISFEELQPRMFSFNSPFGACEECHGLGVNIEFNPELIIPDKSKSIIEGAIEIYGKMDLTWRSQQIDVVGKKFGFNLYTPIDDFTKKQLNVLLYGTDKEIKGRWSNGANMNMENGWEGLIPQSERLYKKTESEYRKNMLSKYMSESVCQECNGKRLKEKVLNVLINKQSIMDVTDLSIKNSIDYFKNLQLSKKESFIAKQILKELQSRLNFLDKVGLSYLTLSRKSGTLSGGEAQRIRLATQIGSNLMGVLYILDEPSIGLHQRDNHKLIETLHTLRNLGNTLIVVEHDEDTIRKADYVVDIGPGAGIHGGKITATGTPLEIEKNKDSITGKYLSGDLKIPLPKKTRKPDKFIEILGAKQNNLKNFNIKIPTSIFVTITGVSGSGKSTLINEILYKALMKKLHDSKENPGKHDKLITNDLIDKTIIIDQSPIGKTPRSNPATYIKAFDDIRQLFSETKEAKIRGYKTGRFSFNVPGGRCEKCEGDGNIKIEMNFLPDVYIECEECKGKRYNKETLEIRFKNKSIADILQMSVEDAVRLFENIPKIQKKLVMLNKVGLDYIKLGQSSTTLSGGESQRIKLTKELAKRQTGKTLYLLDEPTTGLHFHDINKLLNVLNSLVDKGNTILVIEHNLDVIKCSDYIIDLGPEGGDLGGEIVAQGTLQTIMKNKRSYTGKYLKEHLEREKRKEKTI